MTSYTEPMTWDKFRTAAVAALPKIKRNAVVLAPAVLAAVNVALAQPRWQDALYVGVGVVLRQFFTSPTFEVRDRVQNAYVDGYMDAVGPHSPEAP